jgi:hypothetical protein
VDETGGDDDDDDDDDAPLFIMLRVWKAAVSFKLHNNNNEMKYGSDSMLLSLQLNVVIICLAKVCVRYYTDEFKCLLFILVVKV